MPLRFGRIAAAAAAAAATTHTTASAFRRLSPSSASSVFEAGTRHHFSPSRSFSTVRHFTKMSQNHTDASPWLKSHGSFELLQSFALPYAPEMKVQKWKSTKTGLTLVWADFPSPLLNAYMTVPTEIFTDSGVPHTLEHLIFLGSHDYPFKGILDSLANRAFASGTNAWTANDHTAYTLTCASADGFLRMLPVYADHLFRPTITDAGFTTEVYHINGKGQDAGVVFSEMQGRENTPGDLLELRTQRSLYPEGNAYRSETGGLMEKLRVLTAQEIRDYHSKYYAPHNTALVVTGPLHLEELLQAVSDIDESLTKNGKSSGPSGPPTWVRPFVQTASAKAPVIDGTEAGDLPSLYPVDDASDPSKRDPLRRKTTVDFPEEDESMGEVYITWLGPKVGDWLQDEAIGVLSTYLTDSAVSPISKAFIERDDPLCTDIYLSSETKAGAGVISAYCTSVPTEKLDSLDGQLIDLLRKISTEGIDMERMQLCIKRDRIKVMNQLETKPSESFADVLIQDHLYGEPSGKDLSAVLDDMSRYAELATWSGEQWRSLLEKWLVNNARLVVCGRPSKPLVKSLREETRALEKKRREELGKDGLRGFEEKLEAARKENDQPIPEDILSNFKIPSESSIAWISNGRVLTGTVPTSGRPTEKDNRIEKYAESVSNPLDQQIKQYIAPELDTAKDLPFPIHFTQTASAFVSIAFVFPTSRLAPHLRPLLQLYLSTLFSLPIKRDGRLLPFEEVVKGLDEDTVEYDAGLGVGSGFGENVCIDLKVEKAKYLPAVRWLRDLVWESNFAIERLKVATAKMVQSLPEMKRDGRSLSWSLLRSMTHDHDHSTSVATSILSLVPKLPELNERLATEPDSVVKDLEDIRHTIFTPANLVVAVAGDICSVEKPLETWAQEFGRWKKGTRSQGHDVAPPAVRVPWSREVLTPLGRQPAKSGLICPLPTVESSYAVFTAKGLPDYDHPDNAALVVVLAILNALESVLWRYIRGAGLAYGASIRSDIEAAQLHFSLYRSPDSSKAFKEARKVIRAVAVPDGPEARENPLLKLEQVQLDSAKSTLHFSVADAEGTVSQAAAEVFVDEIMRGVPRSRGRRLLESVGKVTLADCERVLRQYVLPLFEPETSICAVVCNPSRYEEVHSSLSDAGYILQKRELDLGKDDESDSGSVASDDESSSGSGSESGTDSEMSSTGSV